MLWWCSDERLGRVGHNGKMLDVPQKVQFEAAALQPKGTEPCELW